MIQNDEENYEYGIFGKFLSKASDYQQITQNIDIINNLKEKINDNQEEVFKLEITSFVHGLTKNTLRIPKEKMKEYDEQVKKVSSILGKDKKINIAILTKLLHELIKNDKSN
jgi:hypothetical protein